MTGLRHGKASWTVTWSPYFHQYLEIVVISLPYLRKTAGLGYRMVDSRLCTTARP